MHAWPRDVTRCGVPVQEFLEKEKRLEEVCRATTRECLDRLRTQVRHPCHVTSSIEGTYVKGGWIEVSWVRLLMRLWCLRRWPEAAPGGACVAEAGG